MINPTTPFGRYLRTKRTAAGLSLRDLAERLNLSHVFLGEVERGRRAPLSETHWPRLMAALPEVTPQELRQFAQSSRPIELDLSSAPAQYTDLAWALARRIESQDLTAREVASLMRLLKGEE